MTLAQANKLKSKIEADTVCRFSGKVSINEASAGHGYEVDVVDYAFTGYATKTIMKLAGKYDSVVSTKKVDGWDKIEIAIY